MKPSIFQSGLTVNKWRVLDWLHHNTARGEWIDAADVIKATDTDAMMLKVLHRNGYLYLIERDGVQLVSISSRGRAAI